MLSLSCLRHRAEYKDDRAASGEGELREVSFKGRAWVGFEVVHVELDAAVCFVNWRVGSATPQPGFRLKLDGQGTIDQGRAKIMCLDVSRISQVLFWRK